MPAKDRYHEAVKQALISDGWTITHDPYTLTVGQKDVFVDLSAERAIASELIVRPVLEDLQVAIISFDPLREVIVQWIP